IPVQSVEAALAAMGKKDRRELVQFFRNILECEPKPEYVYAFWKITNRSRSWRRIGGFRLLIYLRAAVKREGKRIRHRWQAEGIRTNAQLKRDALAAKEMERTRTPRPERTLAM